MKKLATHAIGLPLVDRSHCNFDVAMLSSVEHIMQQYLLDTKAAQRYKAD